MPRLLIAITLALCCTTAAAVAAPAKADLSDDEFRDQVKVFTAAHKRVLLSWGTVQLDGAAKRFAGLGVELGANNDPARAADQTGAYIIEVSPTKFTLITYPWDATTFHVSDGEGPDGRATGAPPWLVLEEGSIYHGQNHNHGKAYVWFGLRNGQLVVFHDQDENVRRDPETVGHDYIDDDGNCIKRCPPLAGHRVNGYELVRIAGSAKTIAGLPSL